MENDTVEITIKNKIKKKKILKRKKTQLKKKKKIK